jgi:hypothetical protein
MYSKTVVTYLGDQIGRFFAHWVIVYYWLLEKYRSRHILGGNFFPQLKLCVSIWTKNEFGNIFGDFFPNSSGHPATYICTELQSNYPGDPALFMAARFNLISRKFTSGKNLFSVVLRVSNSRLDTKLESGREASHS